MFSALKRHGTNRKHERAWSDQIFESPVDALKPLPRFRSCSRLNGQRIIAYRDGINLETLL